MLYMYGPGLDLVELENLTALRRAAQLDPPDPEYLMKYAVVAVYLLQDIARNTMFMWACGGEEAAGILISV